MEFFNIGALELIFILGLAIVVLGPQRTAELAAEIGQLVARLRRSMNLLRDEFTQRVEEETRSVRKVRETIEDPLGDRQALSGKTDLLEHNEEDPKREEGPAA